MIPFDNNNTINNNNNKHISNFPNSVIIDRNPNITYSSTPERHRGMDDKLFKLPSNKRNNENKSPDRNIYNANNHLNIDSMKHNRIPIKVTTSTPATSTIPIPTTTTPIKTSFFDHKFTTPPNGNLPLKNGNYNNSISPKLHSPIAQTNQYSHLLKSMCNPSFTTLKPRDNQFTKPKGCSLISSIELGKILSTKPEKHLLILDTRPFADRSKSFIKNSLHICLPSTLLRRKNFTMEKLVESLPVFEQKIVLEKLNLPPNELDIILYDNTSNQTDNNISLALSGIAIKILNYHNFIDYNDKRNIVSILESGFPQFEKLFPEFITNYHSSSTLSQVNLLNDNQLSNSTNQMSSSSCSSSNSFKVSPFNDTFHPGNMPNIDYYNSLTPPLPSSSNSNEQNVNESPISSSSPISALFKFQLPTTKTLPTPLFKFSQNEEIMNLESYLSAVNINEENQRSQLNDDLLQTPNLHTFQFPKRVEDNKNNTTTTATNTPDLQQSITNAQLKDKLNVQLKYDKLLQNHSQQEIDAYIPKWFQKLMLRPKIQFIARYQRLDILEKKRLNSSISKIVPMQRSTICNENHKQSESEVNFTSTTYTRPKLLQKRSLSQPNIQTTTNTATAITTTTRKHSWLKDLDSEDEDDENDQIIISSGVELGSKNRYKDIFPYEHTRVHLKKASIDSVNLSNTTTISEEKEWDVYDSNDSIEEDISENYINANYLHIPDLDLTETPPTSAINNTSTKVRYIATQAPMFSTVHDFYTCILNDNIPLILSLTNNIENGIEKCFKYWKERDYDGIQVKCLEENEFSDSIIIRRIQLIYDNGHKSYEVLQVQLTTWPDLGVVKAPKDIIQLMNLKNIIMQRLSESQTWSYMSTPTIVVHCSAGCGRTGTWCTIDSIISNLSTFNFLQNYYSSETSTYDPISWIVNIFRKQRISMVQNINQFLLIYDCLLYYFTLKMNDDLDIIKDTSLIDTPLHDLTKELEDLPILNSFINSKLSVK